MKKLLSLFVTIALVMVFSLSQAALTVTIDRTLGKTGDPERIRDVSIAYDSSYLDGGESLTPAMVSLVTIHSVDCEPNDGLMFQYDYTNELLKAYGPTHSYQNPIGAGVVKPVLTLTNTADLGVSEAALPVYVVEGYGNGSTNILTLSSVTNGNTDILASFEETTSLVAPGTPRYFVEDDNTPSGVILYSRTSDHRLQFVSPTEQDAYIIAPIEAIANTVSGYALKVKVYHSATAATSSSIVYFDDNGAADAQLLKTGAGAIVAGDIELLGPEYFSLLTGLSAAQVGSTADLSGVTDLGCRITGTER